MMPVTALVACLAAGLALALVVMIYLAASLPQRVARIVLQEREEADRARAEKAALKAATAAEVQVLVYALRTYHDEIAARASVAREITIRAAAEEVKRIVGPLRAFVECLGTLAGAPYAEALVDADAGVETSPRPDHAPASRERPAPHASLPRPRGALGSTPTLPSMPALAQPSTKPAPVVSVESRAPRGEEGGAS
jgi:hypothetical protein